VRELIRLGRDGRDAGKGGAPDVAESHRIIDRLNAAIMEEVVRQQGEPTAS